jgi:hypothetical protein
MEAQTFLRTLAVYQTLTVSALHLMPEACIIVGIVLQPQVSSSTEQDGRRDLLTRPLSEQNKDLLVRMLAHLSGSPGERRPSSRPTKSFSECEWRSCEGNVVT